MLWALADSSAALFSGFTALAQVLNLPEQDAQEQQLAVNAVTRWLRQERGWLLILDNADEPQIVKEFLPPDHQGRLLLTSRARVFDALGVRRPLSLEKMSAAEAQEFLLNRSGILAAKPNAAQFPSWEGQGVGQLLNQEERAALQQLAQELDGLPLALEQAGAYILRQQCTFSHYLASYRKRRLSLLKQAQPLNHAQSIATTWALNFEQVQQRSAAAADLLSLNAFLHPEAIPLEIITDVAAELGPHIAAALADLANDPLLVDELLEPLTAYSLIRRNLDQNSYDTYRPVQAALQADMDAAVQRRWAERAVIAVSRVFPYVEFETWPVCERLLPQAQTCADLIEHWNMQSEAAGRLLNQTGSYLKERARYTEAEPLYLRALAMREQALGPQHPHVALSLNNLGFLYCKQGRYAAAEPLYLRALTIWENALGQTHPYVAAGLKNYAALLRATGRETEAAQLEARAAALRAQHAQANPAPAKGA